MVRRAASRSPEALLAEPERPEFRQARSKRSYLALLDAAEKLFASQGYDLVGTPEIAEKAGVSVGTFYRYFEDKHEVYLEIMRRTLVTAYHVTIEGLTPERFIGKARQETIGAACRLLFEHVLERPQLMRSFMEMSLRDAQVGELRRAFDQLVSQRIGQLIETVTERVHVPDPEATGYVVYSAAMQAAYGLAIHLVPTVIGRERAITALTTLIDRALFPG